jgi:hypothetical protein
MDRWYYLMPLTCLFLTAVTAVLEGQFVGRHLPFQSSQNILSCDSSRVVFTVAWFKEGLSVGG